MKNRIVRTSGHKSSLGRIIFVLSAVFAVTAVITASLFLTAGPTEGKEAKTVTKYYSSMKVSSDETLWDIAKKYCSDKESAGEYVAGIKKLNNMTDDTLYEGMNIVYYYYVAGE